MLSKNKMNIIDGMVLTFMEKYHVPGISVAVASDQEIYFKNSYGFKDLEKELRMDNDSLIYIASATKAFTALSCAMLVERGKLSWKDPIAEYLNLFETADKYITQNATVIDVLSHRTGIEEFPILGEENISRAELFDRMKDYVPNKPFRTSWQYNNSLYAIAGYIVELLSGKSWEEFVKENIFTPLQMKQSDFSFIFDWDHNNRSKLYVMKDGQRELFMPYKKHEYDTWGPAGSINASITDIGNWLLFLIGGGVYKGSQLLSKENFDVMTAPHCITSIMSEKGAEHFSTALYCLGWVAQWYKGEQIIWHNGSFGSFISFMPDRRTGIAVLPNMDSPMGRELSYEIYDLLKHI